MLFSPNTSAFPRAFAATALACFVVLCTPFIRNHSNRSNLELLVPGIRDCFLTTIPSGGQSCLLSYGDPPDEKFSQSCACDLLDTLRIYSLTSGHDASSGPVYLAQLPGRAPVVFVPAAMVSDPYLPLYSEFVRLYIKSPPLPRFLWVNLYLDNHYQGLFLQTSFPFQIIPENGGPHIDATLAVHTAGGLSPLLTTRFEIRDQSFVDLFYSHARVISDLRGIKWQMELQSRVTAPSHLYLLSLSIHPPNRSVYVMPLPVPFDFTKVLAALFGPAYKDLPQCRIEWLSGVHANIIGRAPRNFLIPDDKGKYCPADSPRIADFRKQLEMLRRRCRTALDRAFTVDRAYHENERGI